MSNLRATFKREDDGDHVEIVVVGDTVGFRTKVTPEHIAQFPEEWAAFQAATSPEVKAEPKAPEKPENKRAPEKHNPPKKTRKNRKR